MTINTDFKVDFSTANKLGTTGENITKHFFKDVFDVDLYKCNTRFWQDADIDFTNSYLASNKISNLHNLNLYKILFANLHKNNLITIEVKTDKYKSNNFCIETISNTNKNTLGWGLYTKADYIVSVRPSTNKIYILDGQRLKEYTTKNHHLHNKLKNSTKDIHNNILYQSEYFLINYDKLSKLNILLYSAYIDLDTNKTLTC